MQSKTLYAIQTCTVFLIIGSATLLHASDILHWVNQTVYVSIYSDIHADNRYKDKPFDLTATLSIRNTDLKIPLSLDIVDYYDSPGNKLQSYVTQPVTVAPLESTRFIVRETDRGGSGAKFLVHWHSNQAITAPIIESVMIGTQMQQSISFICQGRIIDGTHGKTTQP